MTSKLWTMVEVAEVLDWAVSVSTRKSFFKRAEITAKILGRTTSAVLTKAERLLAYHETRDQSHPAKLTTVEMEAYRRHPYVLLGRIPADETRAACAAYQMTDEQMRIALRSLYEFVMRQSPAEHIVYIDDAEATMKRAGKMVARGSWELEMNAMHAVALLIQLAKQEGAYPETEVSRESDKLLWSSAIDAVYGYPNSSLTDVAEKTGKTVSQIREVVQILSRGDQKIYPQIALDLLQDHPGYNLYAATPKHILGASAYLGLTHEQMLSLIGKRHVLARRTPAGGVEFTVDSGTECAVTAAANAMDKLPDPPSANALFALARLAFRAVRALRLKPVEGSILYQVSVEKGLLIDASNITAAKLVATSITADRLVTASIPVSRLVAGEVQAPKPRRIYLRAAKAEDVKPGLVIYNDAIDPYTRVLDVWETAAGRPGATFENIETGIRFSANSSFEIEREVVNRYVEAEPVNVGLIEPRLLDYILVNAPQSLCESIQRSIEEAQNACSQN